MRKTAGYVWLIGCLIGQFLGCANVKVHKIPVEDRLSGSDENVKGFRYYLTRPYLMVGKQIPVMATHVPLRLATPKAADSDLPFVLVAQVPDKQGDYPVYDASGNRLSLKPSDVILVERNMGNPSAGLNPSTARERVIESVSSRVQIECKTYLASLTPQVTLSDDDAQAFLNSQTALREHYKGLGGQPELKDVASTALAASLEVANALTKLKAGVEFSLDQAKKDAIILIALPYAAPTGANEGRLSPLGSATFSEVPKDMKSDGEAESGKSTKANEVAAFQVVFLPDFEEQYAIRNKNFQAKTKYQFQFRNGTDLQGASGSYNSTDVPVKIIETVGSLITAAGEVAKTSLNPLGEGAAKLRFDAESKPAADFYLKIEQVLEPGAYRIQKSWERTSLPGPGSSVEDAAGLFSDVGLPLMTSYSIVTREQYIKSLGRPSP